MKLQNILILFLLSFACVACGNQGRNAGAAPEFQQTWTQFVQAYVRDTNAYNKVGIVTASGVIPDAGAFWIAIGQGANADIVRVDQATGEQSALFETRALKRALRSAGAEQEEAQNLEVASFEFLNGSDRIVYTLGEARYVFDLTDLSARKYSLADFYNSFPDHPRIIADQFPATLEPLQENTSKDNSLFVTVQDSNIYVRRPDTEELTQLTTDGEKWNSWGGVNLWEFRFNADPSPNGEYVFAVKLDGRDVYKLPIMYWLEEKERVDEYLYPLSGGAFPIRQPHIINTRSGDVAPLNTPVLEDRFLSILSWRDDGSEVWFMRMNRAYNEFELLAANPENGNVRTVLTETNDTFIDTPYTGGPMPAHLLTGEDGFLFLSERTGLRQIYHYDLDGALVQTLTDGAFPVFDIVSIDEDNGWIYYRTATDASRPYDKILHRVSLNGGPAQRLVSAAGQHQTTFAEDNRSFIVTHSSISTPPQTELRQADGALVGSLVTADLEKLPSDWTQSEEFVVKARDGETDLYGVMMFPPGFDPNKTYPVLEAIYGGMQADFIPRAFLGTEVAGDNGYGKMARAMTYADFIVVHINSQGTRGRGKAFHDTTHGSWPEGLVEEHAHVIRQLAKDRPYMNVNNVGIFGASWGGYMTLRALLLEPGLYKAGVSIVPVAAHNETLNAAEPFIGTPQSNPEAYENGSLFSRAGQLEGDLLLMAGPLDVNAGFAHTMKFADALIEANKDFDLYVMPGMNHSLGCCGAMRAIHAQTKAMIFFQEHLSPPTALEGSEENTD